LNILFRREAFVSLLLVAFQAAAQIQAPDVAATELVRQTVAHELAAIDTGGQYMYRVNEETPQGSETSVMIETRDWATTSAKLRACCCIQRASGWGVQPANRTYRAPRWMKNSA
jgi:hypothetical protein